MDPTVSTPLLPVYNTQVKDHPIQLRICHSSWKCIPQNVLFYLRVILLVNLISVACLLPNFELNAAPEVTKWRILFDYSVISFVLVLVYQLVAFSWTFTHLYFPHIDDNKSGWEYFVLRCMSLPLNIASLRKQFYCSLLFMLAIVVPFTSSTLFWLDEWKKLHDDFSASPPPLTSGIPNISAWNRSLPINATLPIGPPNGNILGDSWYPIYCRLNLHVIIPFISFIELFLLSSVKRPVRTMGAHVLAVMVFSCLYLGWASLGVVLTSWYPFHWLNVAVVGSREIVAAYCATFVVLSALMFAVVQGLLTIRDSLQRMTKKSGGASRNAALVSDAGEDYVD